MEYPKGHLYFLRVHTSECVSKENINDRCMGYSMLHFFFIRTSNFGAQAECPYFFGDLSLETFLRCSQITWYSISINQCGVDQESSSSMLRSCAACSDTANKMSRQQTLGKFGRFTKSIEHRGSQRERRSY